MKNIERQKALDKKKWFLSEKQNFDMSGFMLYCEYCENRGGLHGECQIKQLDREMNCVCARAYNRMVRNENKGDK